MLLSVLRSKVRLPSLTVKRGFEHLNCVIMSRTRRDVARLQNSRVFFFSKVSKEIGIAWCKSVTRAKRASTPEAREKKP